ncbi:MAG TPA: DUF1579 domain-containing protein [Planctomycetota bacterium]
MKLRLFSVVVSLLASTSMPLAAQDLPQPGPEHKKFAASAGTWDAVLESVDHEGKPSKSKGVSEAKVTMGGLWLVEDFTADFGGMPFQGHGVTGFDVSKGKYVTTWVDSMLTSFLVLEGNFDKDGKILTMTGMGVGNDGQPAKYRNVFTWKSADSYVFEMFLTGKDGKEMPALKITYTRRAAKADGAKK